jgi:hypothetical protein
MQSLVQLSTDWTVGPRHQNKIGYGDTCIINFLEPAKNQKATKDKKIKNKI